MATTVVPYEQLAADFAGQILLPDHPSYESERRLFNGMFDARPAALAQCRGVVDVVAAIRFAREHGLDVCVRGGGHAVDGRTIVEDGFVIDLGPMNGVFVDPARQRAIVQAGARWFDVDRETQLHALAVTGGAVSHTGVAGLTLGGGVGWLSRLCGSTCANVISFEGVTVDGEFVRASASENPELYWGLRGGGGNFIIVTSFEFQLHPVGPLVVFATATHSGDGAAEALRIFRDFAETVPDEVALAATLGRAPYMPPYLPAVQGELVCGFVCIFFGDLAEGARILQPLVDWGSPIDRTFSEIPYTRLQMMPELTIPRLRKIGGARTYSKSLNFMELTDEAIDALAEVHRTAPVELGKDASAATAIVQQGGALTRIAADSMAFTATDSAFYFDSGAAWEDPDDDEIWIGFQRRLAATMEPFATGGQYLNYGSDADVRKSSKRSARDKYRRLVDLKNRWDPDNILRHNKNIPPSI